MKNILMVFIGISIGSTFFACAMGGKSHKPDYDDFPVRSDDNSIWTRCVDNDTERACKYVCQKYDSKNKCKKDQTKTYKINIDKALQNGFVLVSKPFIVRLLRSK